MAETKKSENTEDYLNPNYIKEWKTSQGILARAKQNEERVMER
jgi:hypothetical protein